MPRLDAIEPPWDQRLARALVRPLRDTPVTPNAITSMSLACGLAGAWLFMLDPPAPQVGAALFMLACLLDHGDGELARMTGRSSRFGHYYDLAVDGVVMSALFVAIGIGLSDGALGRAAIRLGLVAGGAVALTVLVRFELERRGGKAAVRQPNVLGFEHQDGLYLIGPAAWLGLLEPFLVLAAIGTPLYLLRVLWTFRQRLATPRDGP